MKESKIIRAEIRNKKQIGKKGTNDKCKIIN